MWWLQSHDGKLLVVSVLYKIASASNSALSHSLRAAKLATTRGKYLPPFDAQRLLPQFKSFFLFRGSMTTPPCTGGSTSYVRVIQHAMSLLNHNFRGLPAGVTWVLMQHPSTISAKLLSLLPDKHNFRPPQPIGMRKVEVRNQI